VSQGPTLPPAIRRAAGLATALAVLVLLGATNDLSVLVELDSYRAQALGLKATEPMVQLSMEVARTQLQLLDNHRELSMAVLFLLSLAAGFVFAASLRMLRPRGMPLSGIRHLLGRAAVAAAVFRTLDGAQEAALVRKAALLVAGRFPAQVAAELQAPEALVESLRLHMGWLLPAVSVAKTAVLAAGFAAVAHYFQAASVQRAVEAADRLLPSDE
jgi:hypothetical protein